MKYFSKFFLYSLPLLLIILFFSIQKQEQKKISLPVITVINPIRGKELGLEKANLVTSLQEQWQVGQEAGVHATWLWQYSAMEEANMVDFAKARMQDEEFGIFLEIDRNWTKKSAVQYRGRGPWWFSDGLLLASYDQNERIKLIDRVFSKFKKSFGYYPKTVGAWWVDAFSISYMQEKYGIIALLQCSDQIATDSYSIWGTPWSIPYVSSRSNAAIPAHSWNDSSQVVTMQWAPRDPTLAYGDSLHSLQDYQIRGYKQSYFDYLTHIYLKEPMDHIVIGLEGGGSPSAYQTRYKNELIQVRKWEKEKKIVLLSARDYAEYFLKNRVILPTTRYFLTKDFQSEDQSFWFHSPNFRAGIHKKNENIFLIDLRDYTQARAEDFSLLPNSQGNIRINTPALIDSLRFPENKLLLTTNNDNLTLTEKNGEITLLSGKNKIAVFSNDKLQLFTLKYEKTFTFRYKNVAFSTFLFLSILYFIYAIAIFKKNNTRKHLLIFLLLLIPLVTAYPFLSTGDITTTTFLFDKKELLLLHLFFNPFGSISLSLFILQLIPFIFLLFSHYLTIVRSNTWYTYAYIGFVISLTIFYAHLPYFPLDKSTYVSVLYYLFLFFIFLCICSFILYQKLRSRRVITLSIFLIPAFFIILLLLILFSRQKYILTPFEIDALQSIVKQNKDVIYLLPTEKPIYKAIRPLLYENYQFAEKLTGKNWKTITRTKDNTLLLPQITNVLIAVPRYLGSELSTEEIKKYNLIKIFDNAQIVVFVKK